MYPSGWVDKDSDQVNKSILFVINYRGMKEVIPTEPTKMDLPGILCFLFYLMMTIIIIFYSDLDSQDFQISE